jgi:hypothetical protein
MGFGVSWVGGKLDGPAAEDALLGCGFYPFFGLNYPEVPGGLSVPTS